jgi:hypothetical protein
MNIMYILTTSKPRRFPKAWVFGSRLCEGQGDKAHCLAPPTVVSRPCTLTIAECTL